MLEATLPVQKELGLYPNPASSDVTITWERIETATTGTIRVFNIQGQELMNKQINISDLNRTNLDVTALVDGIYQITLEYNNTLQQQRIVKQ